MDWPCPRCTLSNPARVTVCGACEWERRVSAPHPPRVPAGGDDEARLDPSGAAERRGMREQLASACNSFVVNRRDAVPAALASLQRALGYLRRAAASGSNTTAPALPAPFARTLSGTGGDGADATMGVGGDRLTSSDRAAGAHDLAVGATPVPTLHGGASVYQTTTQKALTDELTRAVKEGRLLAAVVAQLGRAVANLSALHGQASPITGPPVPFATDAGAVAASSSKASLTGVARRDDAIKPTVSPTPTSVLTFGVKLSDGSVRYGPRTTDAIPATAAVTGSGGAHAVMRMLKPSRPAASGGGGSVAGAARTPTSALTGVGGDAECTVATRLHELGGACAADVVECLYGLLYAWEGLHHESSHALHACMMEAGAAFLVPDPKLYNPVAQLGAVGTTAGCGSGCIPLRNRRHFPANHTDLAAGLWYLTTLTPLHTPTYVTLMRLITQLPGWLVAVDGRLAARSDRPGITTMAAASAVTAGLESHPPALPTLLSRVQVGEVVAIPPGGMAAVFASRYHIVRFLRVFCSHSSFVRAFLKAQGPAAVVRLLKQLPLMALPPTHGAPVGAGAGVSVGGGWGDGGSVHNKAGHKGQAHRAAVSTEPLPSATRGAAWVQPTRSSASEPATHSSPHPSTLTPASGAFVHAAQAVANNVKKYLSDASRQQASAGAASKSSSSSQTPAMTPAGGASGGGGDARKAPGAPARVSVMPTILESSMELLASPTPGSAPRADTLAATGSSGMVQALGAAPTVSHSPQQSSSEPSERATKRMIMPGAAAARAGWLGQATPSPGEGRAGGRGVINAPAVAGAAEVGKGEDDAAYMRAMTANLTEDALFAVLGALRQEPAWVVDALLHGDERAAPGGGTGVYSWLQAAIYSTHPGVVLAASLLICSLVVHPLSTGMVMSSNLLTHVYDRVSMLHPCMLSRTAVSNLGRFKPAGGGGVVAWYRIMLQYQLHPAPRLVASLALAASLHVLPTHIPTDWLELIDAAARDDVHVHVNVQTLRFACKLPLVAVPPTAMGAPFSPTVGMGAADASIALSQAPVIAIVTLNDAPLLHLAHTVAVVANDRPFLLPSTVVAIDTTRPAAHGVTALASWLKPDGVCGIVVLVSAQLWAAWCVMDADGQRESVAARMDEGGGTALAAPATPVAISTITAVHMLLHLLAGVEDVRIVLTPVYTDLDLPMMDGQGVASAGSGAPATPLQSLLSKAIVVPMQDDESGSVSTPEEFMAAAVAGLGLPIVNEAATSWGADASVGDIPPNPRWRRRCAAAASKGGGGTITTGAVDKVPAVQPGLSLLPVVPGMVDGAAHIQAVCDQQVLFSLAGRHPFIRVDIRHGIAASTSPDDLLRWLPRCDILHFTGHGTLQQPLVFSSQRHPAAGGATPSPPFDVKRLLATLATATRTPVLFVLMGCHSGVLALDIAVTLARRGVPVAVVGWATEVDDDGAAVFLSAFYTRLLDTMAARLYRNARSLPMSLVVQAFMTAVSLLQRGNDMMQFATIDGSYGQCVQGEGGTTVWRVPLRSDGAQARPVGVPLLITTLPPSLELGNPPTPAPWVTSHRLMASQLLSPAAAAASRASVPDGEPVMLSSPPPPTSCTAAKGVDDHPGSGAAPWPTPAVSDADSASGSSRGDASTSPLPLLLSARACSSVSDASEWSGGVDAGSSMSRGEDAAMDGEAGPATTAAAVAAVRRVDTGGSKLVHSFALPFPLAPPPGGMEPAGWRCEGHLALDGRFFDDDGVVEGEVARLHRVLCRHAVTMAGVPAMEHRKAGRDATQSSDTAPLPRFVEWCDSDEGVLDAAVGGVDGGGAQGEDRLGVDTDGDGLGEPYESPAAEGDRAALPSRLEPVWPCPTDWTVRSDAVGWVGASTVSP